MVRREKTVGDVERKMIVGSAKPFGRQGVEDAARSAGENAEPWEYEQEERKTCLHGSYCGSVFVVTR